MLRMANLEILPPEIREHILSHLPPMDQFAAAEASPKMEEVIKIQVAVGSNFAIEMDKEKLIIALHEIDCWSATNQAFGEKEGKGKQTRV